MGRDVQFIYVGNDRWFSHSYLNSRAFPETLSKELEAAGSRFAMFHFQTKLLYHQLSEDRARFIEHITEPKFELNSVLKKLGPHRLVAELDGIETMIILHGLFHVMKSFLDTYAKLLARLIDPKTNMSFGKANVNDKKISGGKFIRWLRESAPKEFCGADSLADLLESESRSWITEAVDYRDTLSHYGDIESIHKLSVKLRGIKTNNEPTFLEEDIREPSMPNGQHIMGYASELGINLRSLVKNSLILFPKIKHKELTFRPFDIEQEMWPSSSRGADDQD